MTNVQCLAQCLEWLFEFSLPLATQCPKHVARGLTWRPVRQGPGTSAGQLSAVVREVYLRAPLGSVGKWIASGQLRSFKPARRRLVARADLEAWIEQAACEASGRDAK